jgi:Tol biopolymer transport system component
MLAYTIGPSGVGATFSLAASTLMVVPVPAGVPVQPQPDFAVAHLPVWSPDGKHVIFLGARRLGPPDFDLWVTPVSGGEAIKTGAIDAMRKHEFQTGPYPFALHDGWLLLSAGRGDAMNLYRMRLSPDTWQVNGKPEQLTFGTGRELQPAVARNGTLVFSASTGNTDIYSIPVDPTTGVVTGELKQLTRNLTEDYYPRPSPDGSRIFFVSNRSGNDDVWWLDPATGTQASLLATPARELHPRPNLNASEVSFTSIDKGKLAIRVVRPGHEVPRTVCTDCGVLRAVTSDAAWMLVQNGSPPKVLALNTKTAKLSTIYQGERIGVYAPHLSADDRWVVFQTVEGPASRRLYLAPFRKDQPVPVKDWIPLTDGLDLDRDPTFSPDGKLVYFLSERDGFGCIWALPVHPTTGTPEGKPFVVKHFHNASLSMLNMAGPAHVSLSVGTDKLVLSLGSMAGNLWKTQLPASR